MICCTKHLLIASAVLCKLRGFEAGKEVLCPKEASSLSLSSANLTARRCFALH